MPKSALLVIDFQYDFCEGGALEVKGSDAILGPINRLMESGKYDLIIASKDWHPPDHISFASNHANTKPFDKYELPSTDRSTKVTSVLWPDHCVQDSRGAELHDKLNAANIEYTVLKGEDADAEFYSAFCDVHKDRYTKLHSILRDNNITNITVVGLAFDYCVTETAIDASRLGYKTSIDMKCTRGISDEGVDQARKKCASANVELLE